MSDWLETLIPSLLIKGGRVDRRAMLRELMTEDEVRSQLRLHGIEDLTRIHRAYIEPNGMVSVILDQPQEEDAGRPPEL